MRHPIIAATAALAFVLAAGTGEARGLSFNTDSCTHEYSTPYDIDVTDAGLSFHRTDGKPARIFIHDGGLRVDGKDVRVSDTDAASLRRYEEGVRRLMPQVATVAREAIEIGFSAMTTVTLAFADGDQRSHLLEKLKRKQANALRDIDEGVGAGHWSHDRMAETIGGSVSDTVGELVGSVASSAVTAALSGDSGKLAALQGRADALDKAMDRELDKRSKSLEERADRICPQLNGLADIQKGWRVRLADGSALELMTIEPKGGEGENHARDDRKVVSM